MGYPRVPAVAALIRQRQLPHLFDADPLLSNLHPLTYNLWMEQNYGGDWDDFEPEVVRAIFKGQPDNVVQDILDLHGPWSVLRNQGMEMPLHAFENVIQAFNGREPELLWHQDLTVPDLCDTLACIRSVMPLDAGHALSTWIYAFLSWQDFEVVRPEWDFIREYTPAKGWISIDNLPDGGLYPAINEACEMYMAQRAVPVDNFLQALAGQA